MTRYLLDTHALACWVERRGITDRLVELVDDLIRQSRVVVSSVAFWEIALLVKKQKLHVNDINVWQQQVLGKSGVPLLEPTVNDMINSTLLPDLHKDPFDRLLIAQAQRHQLTIITRDSMIPRYAVQTFWIK